MDSIEINKCLKDHDYLLKKYYQGNKFCMAYNKQECSSNICEAHTISKKYLNNLARDGHVYLPVGSSHNKKNLYEFKLKGISEVTKISGFCKGHDDTLFQSFEKKNDFTGAYEQIYDLTFRALCREYFQKKCLLLFFNSIKSSQLKRIDKTGYLESDLFKQGRSHLIREIRDHKLLYEQLKKYKDRGLSSLLIETTKLPFAATGILFPICGPNGNKIQNEKHKQLGFISNIIPLIDKSYIIISTVKSLHNNLHKDFLSSITKLHQDMLINYLLTNFFLYTDNIALEPTWFEQQNDNFKEKLITLMNLQVGAYAQTNSCKGIINFCEGNKPTIINIKKSYL